MINFFNYNSNLNVLYVSLFYFLIFIWNWLSRRCLSWLLCLFRRCLCFQPFHFAQICGFFLLFCFEEIVLEGLLYGCAILDFVELVAADLLDLAKLAVCDNPELIGDATILVHVEAVHNYSLDATSSIRSIHQQDHSVLSSLSMLSAVAKRIGAFVQIVRVKVHRQLVRSAVWVVIDDQVDGVEERQQELLEVILQCAIVVWLDDDQYLDKDRQSANHEVLEAVKLAEASVFGLVDVDHGEYGNQAQILVETQIFQRRVKSWVWCQDIDEAFLGQYIEQAYDKNR